jgi:hypothetical protein
LFSLSSFSSFSLFFIRCNLPFLLTIKGETGRPMPNTARQANYGPFQADMGADLFLDRL